jgi:hypothetical protein
MPRFGRCHSLLTTLATATCITFGWSAANAQPGVQRLPWEPQLIVNADNQLCRRFHDLVQADFRAVAPADLADLAASLGQVPAPREVNDLVVEFDNVRLLNGEPANVVVSVGSEDGAGGYRSFDIYMVLSGGRTSIDLTTQWRALNRVQRPGTGVAVEHPDGARGAYIVSAQRSMRGGGERSSRRDRVTVTQQVVVHGTFFALGLGAAEEVLGNIDRSRLRAEPEAEFVVFLASPMREGGLAFTCMAAIAPRPSEIAPPFTGSGPAALYRARLDRLTGAIPGECRAPGTMFGLIWHNAQVNRADHLHLAMRQPWRLPPAQDLTENGLAVFHASHLSDGDSVTAQALRLWSLSDPISRRQFLRLSAALTEIVADLANYYRAGFGMADDVASDWAQRAILALLRATMGMTGAGDGVLYGGVNGQLAAARIDWRGVIEAAQNPENPSGRRGRWTPDPAWRGSVLGRAALAGAPADALRALTSSRDDLNARLPAGEAPLVMALGNDAALAWMIGAGADVNSRNAFGKTPLMFAAHLDLPAAVRALLTAGADVNAATNERTSEEEAETCRFSITFRRRTALMYAAENAGLETIAALVRAGADVAARDSRGRDMLDYLSRNTVLTSAQRETARRLLSSTR